MNFMELPAKSSKIGRFAAKTGGFFFLLGRTGAYGLNVLRSFLCVTGWPRLCPRKFADRPVAAPLQTAPPQARTFTARTPAGPHPRRPQPHSPHLRRPARSRAAPSQPAHSRPAPLAGRTSAARTLTGRTLAGRNLGGPHPCGPHLRRPALSHPSHSQPAPLHAATSDARTQKYRRTHAAPKYTSDNRRPGMSAIGKGRGRRPQSIPMQACVFYGRRTKFITHSHTAGTGLARAGPPAWLRRTFPRAH